MPDCSAWGALLGARLAEIRRSLPGDAVRVVLEDGRTTDHIGYLHPMWFPFIRTAALPGLGLAGTDGGEPLRLVVDARGTTPEAVLDSLSLALRKAGLVCRRDAERLDVTTSDGRVLCTAERPLFRVLGMRTRAVRLTRFTRAPGFPAARRAPTKKVGPGLWDNIAAGLAAAGEDDAGAMLRELNEEAGQNLGRGALRRIGDFTALRAVENGILNEVTTVFRAEAEPVPFTNLDGEVDAFRRLDEAALLEELLRGGFMPEAAIAFAMDAAPGVTPEEASGYDLPIHKQPRDKQP